MPKILLDPCVEDELWSIWRFIAEDNPNAASRVVDAAFDTFETLAANPALGRLRRFGNPKLHGIRSRRVAGFDNYIIFYRAIAERIHVIHVYHGARDIEALFG